MVTVFHEMSNQVVASFVEQYNESTAKFVSVLNIPSVYLSSRLTDRVLTVMAYIWRQIAPYVVIRYRKKSFNIERGINQNFKQIDNWPYHL